MEILSCVGSRSDRLAASKFHPNLAEQEKRDVAGMNARGGGKLGRHGFVKESERQSNNASSGVKLVGLTNAQSAGVALNNG